MRNQIYLLFNISFSFRIQLEFIWNTVGIQLSQALKRFELARNDLRFKAFEVRL